MRMRRHHAKVIGRDGESGHFLVEAAIGLVIFTIALLSAMQFLRWNMDPLLMQERQDKAAKQAESVLNELAARKNSNLPAGGSFAVGAQGDPTRNADNSVTLNCSTAYCDQIVAAPQAAGTAYDFTRADWGAAAPAGGMQIYVRAWRVETLDDARNYRRITVAVFPTGSGEPLAVRKSEIVQR
jgi:type II secretory pathway pseudopilin PulG